MKRHKEYEERIEYKFILLGDSTVGKSAIFSRFSGKSFTGNSFTTIGFEKIGASFNKLEIDKEKNIYKDFEITLFDTAGQERYKGLAKSYFRGSQGIILIYSINNITTFEHIQTWLDSIKESLSDWKNEGYGIMLLGNKLDIIENDINQRQVLTEEAEKLCVDQGIYWGGECSAKTFDLQEFREIFKIFTKQIFLKVKDDDAGKKIQKSTLRPKIRKKRTFMEKYCGV